MEKTGRAKADQTKGGTRMETHTSLFVLLLSPPPSLPLFLWHEVTPSRRGANFHIHLILSFDLPVSS